MLFTASVYLRVRKLISFSFFSSIAICVTGQINLDSVRTVIADKSQAFKYATKKDQLEISKELAFTYFYTDIDNEGFVEWGEVYFDLCIENEDLNGELYGHCHFLPFYSFYNDSLYTARLERARELAQSMDNLEIDLAISISEAQYASFIEGDFKNGLSLLGEAEFINDRIGVNEMTPNLYYLISSVYKYAGQAQKAISYADRIFALENLGTVDKARAHLAKGIALLDAKKLDSVAYHLNLAGTYFTQLSNTCLLYTSPSPRDRG